MWTLTPARSRARSTRSPDATPARDGRGQRPAARARRPTPRGGRPPGFGAADDWIAERAGEGDVVVTADIPRAARCLAKGARILDPRGRAFTDNDIGEALALRELL